MTGGPSWNGNGFSYSYHRINRKGNLEIVKGITNEIGYKKPRKGPYFTSIALAEISRKGLKTYRGKPLVEFKAPVAIDSPKSQ